MSFTSVNPNSNQQFTIACEDLNIFFRYTCVYPKEVEKVNVCWGKLNYTRLYCIVVGRSSSKPVTFDG